MWIILTIVLMLVPGIAGAAKQWCVSPIVGVGTFPDPYRAALLSYLPAGVKRTVSAIIPSQATGVPQFTFALVLVEPEIGASPDASHFCLPVKALDESPNFSAPVQTASKAFLSAKGIDTSTLTASSSLRDWVSPVFSHLGSPAAAVEKMWSTP